MMLPGPSLVSEGPERSRRPEVLGDAVEDAQECGGHTRRHHADGEASRVHEFRHGEPPPPFDDPDRARGNRQEVGAGCIAPTTRIDEPVSTPTPATTPAAIMNSM